MFTLQRVLYISSLLFCSQEYEKALKYIRTLLKNEPGNKQAQELEKLIVKALKKGTSQSESWRITEYLWLFHPVCLFTHNADIHSLTQTAWWAWRSSGGSVWAWPVWRALSAWLWRRELLNPNLAVGRPVFTLLGWRRDSSPASITIKCVEGARWM